MEDKDIAAVLVELVTAGSLLTLVKDFKDIAIPSQSQFQKAAQYYKAMEVCDMLQFAYAMAKEGNQESNFKIAFNAGQDESITKDNKDYEDDHKTTDYYKS